MTLRPLLAFVAVLALAGCGSLFGSDQPRHSERKQDAPFHPATDILMAYDTNHDGTITRAELEAGLRADFAKADYKHLGKLDEEEARAVNQARLAADQSAASPLIDWNHDGFIDFGEFAANARSLFDQLDRNGDGQLTPDELHPGPAEHHPPPIPVNRGGP
jgi:Ca2+-binding EF-hand superfamily protein